MKLVGNSMRFFILAFKNDRNWIFRSNKHGHQMTCFVTLVAHDSDKHQNQKNYKDQQDQN